MMPSLRVLATISGLMFKVVFILDPDPDTLNSPINRKKR